MPAPRAPARATAAVAVPVITTPAPRLAVVVLSWNRKADTLECLDSLRASSYGNLDRLVVDNASTDGSTVAVARDFPEVHVLESPVNAGLAANNLGVRAGLDRGAAWVLLLNNDTTVPPDTLGQLMETARRHPRAGILGPRIVYHEHPDETWYDGALVTTEHGILHARHLRGTRAGAAPADEARATDFVTGCAMLLRREAIEQVGGIEPRFFAYWEDLDLSLRVRRAGFDLLHVPAAVVAHKVARSFGRGSADWQYYDQRNRFLTALRGSRPGGGGRLAARYLRHWFWEYDAAWREGLPEHARATVDAAWHGVIRRWGRRSRRAPRLVRGLFEQRRQASRPAHGGDGRR
jgi:hypothetical protein